MKTGFLVLKGYTNERRSGKRIKQRLNANALNTLLILILTWSICALVTQKVAESKGRDSKQWFYYGILFGVFGVIAAAFLRTKTAATSNPEVSPLKPMHQSITGEELTPRFPYTLLAILTIVIAISVIAVEVASLSRQTLIGLHGLLDGNV